MNSTLNKGPKLVRELSLLDSILLLASGVIGSGIFLTAKEIAGNTRSSWLFLSIWVIGGVITLLACFAFAEMGAMFPEAGGQYVYLREAYGEFVAFLYGWMIFTVSEGGTIAALGAGFALYIGKVFPVLEAGRPVLHLASFALTRGHVVAIVTIAVQTLINIYGVRRGAILQNIATWVKFAAIAAFVILGLLLGKGSWSHYSVPLSSADTPSLITSIGVALIAVFWAYDGWVYVTWVAGEIKNPQRALPRALIFGITLVGVVYLAINAVYLYALPMATIASDEVVAQTAAVSLFSGGVARWLALMIAVSCFGAMASCIMSGARVYYAMAEDGLFFRIFARVSPRWHTPAASLALQGIWSCVLALSGGYDALFTYVMFMMVLSYLLTVVALFVLRHKLPDAPRPYRCTGYPWLPFLYVILAGAWAIIAVAQKPRATGMGVLIVSIGVPFYFYWRGRKKYAVSQF